MNMAPRVSAVAAAIVAGLLVWPTALAAQSAETTRVYRYLMGTSVEVEAFGRDVATRETAVREAFAAIAEVDRLMSNYRDDSELAAINRAAAREPVHVTAPMLAVLQTAERVSRASSGAFDVTVGPLVRLWGFHDKRPHLPLPSELRAVRQLIDYRKLIIDVAARTVRFAQPGMELDLGGIAKGFAVELAANVLRQHRLAGFIDAGGNQYLLGAPPGKRRWTVAVRDPETAERVLGVIETGEGSVSTSADYANALTVNGRTYGHILDPRTLQPSDAALSVTLVARDATLADGLSKAAFILGPEAGLALIESVPGMAGVIVYRKPDGTRGLLVSAGIRDTFHPIAKVTTKNQQ